MSEDKVILSSMFPKLHPYNLDQLASAIRHFGEVWMHGDGNMYPKKKDSDDRSIFYNQHPVNEAARYRKLYTRVSQVPEDLEDLEDDLVQARRAEDAAANEGITRATGNPLAFSVPPPTVAQATVKTATPVTAPVTAVTAEFAPPPPPPPVAVPLGTEPAPSGTAAPLAEPAATISDAPTAPPVAAAPAEDKTTKKK